MAISKSYFFPLLIVASLFFALLSATDVSHDERAILINGERKIVLSGAIHYPRSTPKVASFRNYNDICHCSAHNYYSWAFIIILINILCTNVVNLNLSCNQLCLYSIDVAWLDSKSKRRWTWCHRDLCVLECAWASPARGFFCVFCYIFSVK